MSKKILVVDDDEKIRLFVKIILEKRGYEVVCVSSGLAAFQVLYEDRPDLILLDVMMPGMNGYEVLKKLKADDSTREIPVIMLTALGMGEDFQKAVSNGVDWYIVKPFNSRQLISRVEFLLTGKKEEVSGEGKTMS